MRRVALPLAAALALSGCVFGPTVACPDDPQPELTCEAAMAAARTQLAGAGAVTDLRFEYGAPCPPGGECPWAGTVGFVTATRVGADPLIVRVWPSAEGGVEAQAPEPIPTIQP
jgi:hypothetical protein